MLFEAHSSHFLTHARPVQTRICKYNTVESDYQIRRQCETKYYVSKTVNHGT